MALVTIDNQPIPDPSKIDVGIFRLSKAQRAADGTMNMEIIAIKRQVELQWDLVRVTDLKPILDLLESATFHVLAYPDPQGAGDDPTRTITVYVGDINMGAWHYSDGTRWWQGVRIGLIER